MFENKDTNLIHLVPALHRVKIERQDFIAKVTQGELFPVRRPKMVIFVHFPEVTEQEFREMVDFAEPSHVIELRTSPRFDIGGLDRRSAFQTFERKRITYCDLTSSSNDENDSDIILNNLAKFFQLIRPTFERPIVFLTSPLEEAKGIPHRVLDACAQFGYRPDSVYEVPHFVNSAV
jgi:hypothetical protein